MTEGGVAQGSIDEMGAPEEAGQLVGKTAGLYIIGCLGIYRTAANDTAGTGRPPCDTINLCYMALAPISVQFGHDRDHTDIWLADATELLPEGSCGHWYPRHVALRAVEIYHCAIGGVGR